MESPSAEDETSGEGLLACPKSEQKETVVQKEPEEVIDTAEKLEKTDTVDESAVKRPWDRYEAALLLEAYLQIKEQPDDETSILQHLGDILKQRSTQLGLPLDIHFLSIEGLREQKEWMASCFGGRWNGLVGSIPKTFCEVSGIYKKDVSWYQLILRHAQREAGTLVTPIKKKKTSITVINGIRVDKTSKNSPLEVESPKKDGAEILGNSPIKRNQEFDSHDQAVTENPLSSISDQVKTDDMVTNTDGVESEPKKTSYHTEEKKDTVNEAHNSYTVSTENHMPSFTDGTNENQEKTTGRKFIEFDLIRDRDYSRYIPKGFSYKEEYISVTDWDDFYVACLKYLFKKHLKAFQVLRAMAVYTKDRYMVAPAYQGALRKPFLLADGYVIEMDLAPNQMMRHVKQVLFKCHILLSDFVFFFEKKGDMEKPKDVLSQSDSNKAEEIKATSELSEKKTEKPVHVSSSSETNTPQKIETSSEQPGKEVETRKEDALSGLATCDLSVYRNFNEAHPIAFSYFGDSETVANWAGMYIRCCRVLRDDYPRVFKVVIFDSIHKKEKMYVADGFSLQQLKHPTWLAKETYLELDVTPNEMMGFIRQMLVKCQVDFENLVFYFSDMPEEFEPADSMPLTITNEPEIEKNEVIEIPCESCPTEVKDSAEEGEAAAFAQEVTEVLKEEFPDGMRQNGIHAKRFKAKFKEKFGRTLDAGNQELLEEIKHIGILRSDGRIYAKDEGMEQDILGTIAQEIGTLLSGEATAVYWECLFERYNAELAAQSIFTKDVMESEVWKRLMGKSYQCIPVGAISVWGKPTVYGQELIGAMKEASGPISIETLHEKFWYWPVEEIKKMLRKETGVVNTGRGRYFYMPNIPLSEEERNVLRQALVEKMEQNEFVTGTELHELLETNCQSFLRDVEFLSESALRKLMAYLFSDVIDVNGAVLVEKGSTMTVNEIFHTFCQRYGELSSSQIREFAQQIGKSGNYWNDVMQNMVRVAPAQWVRRDQVHFPTQVEVAKVLSECMGKRKVIPLSDITLFLGFPPMNVKWNLYVLESYLYTATMFPFQLIQTSSGVAESGVYGSVVKRGCGLDTYEDVLVELLSQDAHWQTERDALGFIVSHKIQATRRVSMMEHIMRRAKARRKEREALDE